MQRILLALGHEKLEKYLKKSVADYKFIGEVTYREAVVKNCIDFNPDILILRETLPGSTNILNIIYEIRTKCFNTRIIFLSKERAIGDPLLYELVSLGVYDIISSNSVTINEIIKLIEKPNTLFDVSFYRPKIEVDETSNQPIFSTPKQIVKYIDRNSSKNESETENNKSNFTKENYESESDDSDQIEFVPDNFKNESNSSIDNKSEEWIDSKIRRDVLTEHKNNQLDKDVTENKRFKPNLKLNKSEEKKSFPNTNITNIKKEGKKSLFSSKENPKEEMINEKKEKKILFSSKENPKEEMINEKKEKKILFSSKENPKEEMINEKKEKKSLFSSKEEDDIEEKFIDRKNTVKYNRENDNNNYISEKNLETSFTKTNLYAFIGSNGGVGCTQVSFNLSVGLAKKGKTLYVDFSEPPYTFANIFMVNKHFTLFRYDDFSTLKDYIVNKRVLKKHCEYKNDISKHYGLLPSNLDMLFLSPLNATDDYDYKDLLINLALKFDYDFIIFDFGNAVLEDIKVFLKTAKSVNIITTQDFNHLSEATRIKRILEGYNVSNINLVVNSFESSLEINCRKIESYLECKVLSCIPYNKEFNHYNYIAVPIVLKSENSDLQNSFSKLQTRLLNKK